MHCLSILSVALVIAVHGIIDAQQPTNGEPSFPVNPPPLSAASNQSPNCSTGSCALMRSAKREHDLEMLKVKILRKLGISQVPNVTIPIPRIPYVERIIQENLNLQRSNEGSDGSGDDYQNDHSANPSSPQSYFGTSDRYPTSTSNDDDPPTIHNIFYFSEIDEGDRRMVRFQFKVTDIQLIVSATLFVYVSRHGDRPYEQREEQIMVNIHRLVAPDRQGGPTTKVLVRKRRVSMRNVSSWLQFDTTQTVLRWIERPSTNLGFYVDAVDLRRRTNTFITNISDSERYRPYMDVHYREPSPGVRSPSRLRRTTSNDCIESSAQSLCCRYPLTLNFTAIGWNFVISPPVVHTYYCSGDCPYLFQPSNPAHVIIGQARGTSTQGGPCCSPTKYSDIDILYLNSNGTIKHIVMPDLIVDKCGCN